MKRPAHQPARSELRLADLKARSPVSGKLMNVKIPAHLVEAIDKLARSLNVPKTAVFVALLNEGLTQQGDAAAKLDAAAATRTVTKTVTIGLDTAKGVR